MVITLACSLFGATLPRLACAQFVSAEDGHSTQPLGLETFTWESGVRGVKLPASSKRILYEIDLLPNKARTYDIWIALPQEQHENRVFCELGDSHLSICRINSAFYISTDSSLNKMQLHISEKTTDDQCLSHVENGLWITLAFHINEMNEIEAIIDDTHLIPIHVPRIAIINSSRADTYVVATAVHEESGPSSSIETDNADAQADVMLQVGQVIGPPRQPDLHPPQRGSSRSRLKFPPPIIQPVTDNGQGFPPLLFNVKAGYKAHNPAHE